MTFQSNKYGVNSRIDQDAKQFFNDDDDLKEEAKSFLINNKDTTDQQSVAAIPVNAKNQANPYIFVPLKMAGSKHTVSKDTKRLIEKEVTLEDLQNMTELFYEKAFADQTLDRFIRSHDDPHGARFAKWIHQRLSGSNVWDRDRATRNQEPVELADGIRHVVHDRSSAHAAAWYSPKRPSADVGRHFKLDECRVWMRLHFWAMRESGMMEKSPSFADYYVRFIGHFVRVYESSAPSFARDSLRWSATPTNLKEYVANGNSMKEVLGLTLEEAKKTDSIGRSQ